MYWLTAGPNNLTNKKTPSITMMIIKKYSRNPIPFDLGEKDIGKNLLSTNSLSIIYLK